MSEQLSIGVCTTDAGAIGSGVVDLSCFVSCYKQWRASSLSLYLFLNESISLEYLLGVSAACFSIADGMLFSVFSRFVRFLRGLTLYLMQQMD